MINASQLKQIAPNCADSVNWAEALDAEFARVNFTKRQAAYFLAQTGHESLDFKHLEENMNYSAERLMVVFPKYFRGVDTSKYARNPTAIGSRVYANRMGNGAEESQEGYKFRGRGLLQVTGKNNYTACSKYLFNDLSLLDSPEKLVEKKYAISSALWFWHANGLASIDDIVLLTKKINGGTIGLDDRIIRFNKAVSVL
jgi:putative chitinase